MDQRVAERPVNRPAEIETPSGKGAGDENFPVASWLIARPLRPHVMRFYTFARAADDVADNPGIAPSDKIERLDAFEATLDGADLVPSAAELRDSLAETEVTDRHARDLLAAFRQDAEKQRYVNWDELIGYCALSANPVGRYLMDLHGEDRRRWEASDALCTVLQILNHLQDCQKDFRGLDRVYVPTEMLAAEGLDVGVLDWDVTPPTLRRVLDQMLDRCDQLLVEAHRLPVRPASRRLHAETKLIVALAERLSARLRREDPLAGRVKLSRTDFLMAALAGVGALIHTPVAP